MSAPAAASPKHELAVRRSSSLEAAYAAFHASLARWIDDCVERYRDEPATDVHDQGTYTISWPSVLRWDDNHPARAFLKTTRDNIRQYFTANDKWHHGYWRRQEVHHGTEHFELFLGTLLDLDPDDGETATQLLDAAEHLGNWVPDLPAWFDWETGLFRSMYLGTAEVRAVDRPVNVPDHLRCVNIALLAHKASGDARYLELAVRHGRRWAEAIASGATALPVAIDAAGGVGGLGEAEASYRSFAGQAPQSMAAAVDRAENLLASGIVQACLDLWQCTRDEVFVQALERVLDVLAGELDDPDAGAAADAIGRYRRVTGRGRYDVQVTALAAAWEPRTVQKLGIDPRPPRSERGSGIGKRSDAPVWFENGRPRRYNPIALALAAEINADEALAVHALDLARSMFDVAVAVFPDGRQHGCAATSVSAIARGHGRENNAGIVTAVLDPLAVHFALRPH